MPKKSIQSAIRIVSSEDQAALRSLLSRRAQRLDEAERAIKPIVQAVRRHGDDALLRYAKRWDEYKGTIANLRVTPEALESAARNVSGSFRTAVREAAKNIRQFCRMQMPKEWQKNIQPGIRVGQIVRPLESVGCYVPGGRFPLPSTLLMTAIPAQVAGVQRIAVCTPRPVREIFAAAHLLGIDELYTVGGAPAIAALAYGTKLIQPVKKIVGPGSAYVAAAKRLVSRDTGIDFIAGPTEVLLIASEGRADWLAADLLAQAEHDADATALLLTPSRKLAVQVASEVDKQLQALPEGSPASISLRNNSAIVVVRDLEEAFQIANRFAPEHLGVPEHKMSAMIQNAGSVFIGPCSPEAAGDYAVGPNHVLPTGGIPGLRGGLSVLDFVKIISVQQLQLQGLKRLAPSIITLARSEGLEAHARSVEIRLKSKNQKMRETK